MGDILPNYKRLYRDNVFAQRLANTINADVTLESIPLNTVILPKGNCYWNVEHMVAQYGGGIIFGWMFLLWNNVCIEAVHHAIWQKEDGTLVDVTENPISLNEKCTVFLRDDASNISLDRVHCIPNRFLALKDNPVLLRYVQLYFKSLMNIKKLQEILWDIGYRCEVQKALARNLPPPDVDMSDIGAEKMDLLSNITQNINGLKFEIGSLMQQLNKAT